MTIRVGSHVVAPNDRLQGAGPLDALEVVKIHSDGTLDLRRAPIGPGHNPPVEWVRVDRSDVREPR